MSVWRIVVACNGVWEERGEGGWTDGGLKDEWMMPTGWSSRIGKG